jgi:hypothetical protein
MVSTQNFWIQKMRSAIMKTRLIQVAKVLLLVFIVSLLIIYGVSVISTGISKSLADMPNERWKQYEAAILTACYSDVYLPSEKLCEWEIIEQRDNTIYVWAFCADVNGQGSSGPVAIYIASDGQVERAMCPKVFDDYKTLFPGDLYEKVNSYQNRFDLDKAWQHLELRFQNRTIPPLIALEGTPSP